MTKITTDAQALAVLKRVAMRFAPVGWSGLSEELDDVLAYLAARLASTSPAPDGLVLPDHKVDDEDPEGFNNGWNCCLSAVRKAIAAPQPVVEKGR